MFTQYTTKLHSTCTCKNKFYSVLPCRNTAKRDENIKEVAKNEQLYYLPKPVKSLALKRAIKQLVN